MTDVIDKRVVVRADPAALAEAVASRFLHRIGKRTAEGKTAHVSLTGGSMGGAVLAEIARRPRCEQVDWSKVHFWWSDERFVGAGDPDRNDAQARHALLNSIDIPAGNIHAMPSLDDGMSLDAAAVAYADELGRFGPTASTATGQLGGPWPSFDICFLGVGPDGHIASLFPDRPEIQVTDRATLPVRESPKPPSERITVTRPVINSSKRVWMVLTGEDKASALGLALAGASYHSVPAAGAKGRRATVFFVDLAAAKEVPPELIDGDY